ncbi:hypothetical protein AB835_10705 [Candidatus Endobugula sertula]|uniref:Outer membrane protein assembly factor BamC n=1 Tax=Candidatus Endobugula sertula TaxID=62101 RepID=A0A1D2QNB3_9GAMM|nr:hypothetical protein AB835_10705 [Candidatus Endobugula sertula]
MVKSILGIMNLLACALVSLVLVGCSSNDEYLQSPTLPPITVPDGLDDVALGQIYRVPAGDGRIATGELKKPLPPALAGNQRIAEPRLKSAGGKSWLVVPKEASATWSHLLLYLQSRQIHSVKQNIFTATIETDWIIESAPKGYGFRYQLRLEAGLQPDLTEIHVVNVKGKPTDVINSEGVWPEKSASDIHEQWFLKEIAKTINVQKSSGDSLIASSISLPKKVQATSVAGEPIIELLINRNIAYQALYNALNSPSFVIYDQDQVIGVLHIDEGIKPKVKKKSLLREVLSVLPGVDYEEEEKVSPYSLSDILSNLPNENAVQALWRQPNNTGGEILPHVPGYLLVLKSTTNGQRAYIRDGYGRPLASSQSKLLLDTIKKQLF